MKTAFIAAALVTSMFAAPVQADDFTDVMFNTSKQIADIHGYDNMTHHDIWKLNKGGSLAFKRSIDGEKAYAAIATCDINCTNIALFVEDDYGTTLSDGRGKENSRLVKFNPQESAKLTFTIIMTGCKSEPCEVQLMLYSKDK